MNGGGDLMGEMKRRLVHAIKRRLSRKGRRVIDRTDEAGTVTPGPTTNLLAT